jgi:mannose/fructose/N-acetylgalactosamine-specific phosphotransferase system component IID
MMVKNKFNTLATGVLTGLIVPIVSFLSVAIYRMSSGVSFKEFIAFLHQADILTKLISLCLVPNLLLFFIFIWTGRLKSARGVILSMFVFGVIILILKIAL